MLTNSYPIPRLEHGLTDEQIAACHEAGRNLMEGSWAYSGVANWFAYYNDGTKEPRLNQGCHAAIGTSLRPNNGKTALAIINENGMFRNKDKSTIKTNIKEEVLFFYGWLMNESVYADVYVNKDPNDQYFILHTNCPTPFMHNCNILGRHAYELSDLPFILFKHYAEQGYDKHLLYVLLFNSGVSVYGIGVKGFSDLSQKGWKNIQPGFDLTQMPVSWSHGHRAHWVLSLDDMVNMIKKRTAFPVFENANRDYMLARNKNTNYNGGANIFSSGMRRTFRDSFFAREDAKEALAAYRQTNGNSVKAVPNPFQRQSHPRLGTNDISYNELIDVCLPWAQNQLNELLSNEEGK